MKTPRKHIATKKEAATNDPKTGGRVVLVGTYKGDQLTHWRGWYNYPMESVKCKVESVKCGRDALVASESSQQPADFSQINELWLFQGTKDQRNYKAEFVGIKTREELIRDYGYPGDVATASSPSCDGGDAIAAAGGTRARASAKPHGTHYALFKTTFLYRHRNDLPGEADRVIVRTADFAKRSPKVAKQLKAYLESPDRNDPDLANRLPTILTQLRPEQLRVCEAAVQLDFYDTFIKPYTVKTPVKHAFVDLFAGCGGLSLGLEEAGFTPVLVNELNPDAMATYLANRVGDFPWLQRNNVNNVKDLVLKSELLQSFIDRIRDELGVDVEKGELDLVCGGPPCQGFSGIGYRRSYSVTKDQLPSNYLFQDMAFLVSRLNPKIFLFENVRGLLTSKWNDGGKNGEIFEEVLKTFKNIGKYHICFKLVHAKDYGVPQNRPRVLIVGLRKDIFPNMDRDGQDAVEAGFLPKPTGGAPDLIDLLGDLIDQKQENGGKTFVYKSDPLTEVQRSLRTRRDGSVISKGEPLEEQEYSRHAEVIIAKFKAMHQNGGVIPEEFRTKKFSQRLLSPRWGSEGPTITACSAPDDYVHFAQPRGMTVREWARLQMFPDWYEFCGKRTTGGLRRAGNPREGIFDRELPKYTQIGNAVPVGLARKVGEHFISLLENAEQGEGDCNA